MKELVFLFLGAVGALLAIFLREAVQHALQRRVIAWQLGGYLLAWKANIVNEGQLVQLYNTVEERLKRLIVSYETGIAAFRAQYLEQTKVRDDIRESIRKALESAGSASSAIDLDELMKSNVEQAVMALSERRSLLLDSKTFVSDKDAAMLGRAAAMNVIQFRTAMTGPQSPHLSISCAWAPWKATRRLQRLRSWLTSSSFKESGR